MQAIPCSWELSITLRSLLVVAEVTAVVETLFSMVMSMGDVVNETLEVSLVVFSAISSGAETFSGKIMFFFQQENLPEAFY